MSHADLAPTRRAIVKQAGALALLGSSASVSAAPSADAELLRLGVLMEAAWADEHAVFAVKDATDTVLGQAYERTAAIVQQIEAHAATTIEGLIVKARACSWTHSGEPVEPDFFAFSGAPSTDERLGAGILRDLLAIGGKPILTS